MALYLGQEKVKPGAQERVQSEVNGGVPDLEHHEGPDSFAPAGNLRGTPGFQLHTARPAYSSGPGDRAQGLPARTG